MDLDELVKLFMTIGLKTNDKKTKLMIAGGVPATKAMSSEQYRRMIGTRRTRGEKTREKEKKKTEEEEEGEREGEKGEE